MNSCLVFFHQPINIAYLGKKKKKTKTDINTQRDGT